MTSPANRCALWVETGRPAAALSAEADLWKRGRGHGKLRPGPGRFTALQLGAMKISNDSAIELQVLDEETLVWRAKAEDTRAFNLLWLVYLKRLQRHVERSCRRIDPSERDSYVNYLYVVMRRRIVVNYDPTRSSDSPQTDGRTGSHYWRYLRSNAYNDQRHFLRHQRDSLPQPRRKNTEPDGAGGKGSKKPELSRPASPVRVKVPLPDGPEIPDFPEDRLPDRQRLGQVVRMLCSLETAPHHVVVFGLKRLLGWTPAELAKHELWRVARLHSLTQLLVDAVRDATEGGVAAGHWSCLTAKLDKRLDELFTQERLRENYADILDQISGELRLDQYYRAFCAGKEPWPKPNIVVVWWDNYVSRALAPATTPDAQRAAGARRNAPEGQ